MLEKYSYKYCTTSVANLSQSLEKSGLILPSKYLTPLSNDHGPELYSTEKLKAYGLQHCLEIIGVLRLAIEISRLDVLLEVYIMSAHLSLPREGNIADVMCV